MKEKKQKKSSVMAEISGPVCFDNDWLSVLKADWIKIKDIIVRQQTFGLCIVCR